jgi:hypothetical protein
MVGQVILILFCLGAVCTSQTAYLHKLHKLHISDFLPNQVNLRSYIIPRYGEELLEDWNKYFRKLGRKVPGFCRNEVMQIEYFNKWKIKHHLEIEQQLVESFFQTQEKRLYLFGTKPEKSEYEQNLVKAEQNIKKG